MIVGQGTYGDERFPVTEEPAMRLRIRDEPALAWELALTLAMGLSDRRLSPRESPWSSSRGCWAMNTAESSAVASGFAWFKSSYSGAEGGDCVEVATDTGAVHIRDTKAMAGPIIRVSREAWGASGRPDGHS